MMEKSLFKSSNSYVLIILLLLFGLSGCGAVAMKHNREVLSKTEIGTSRQKLIQRLKASVDEVKCEPVGMVNNILVERCLYHLGLNFDEMSYYYVFFHGDKYIGWGHKNGVLLKYAKEILPLDNEKALLFLFRSPTEKKSWASSWPEGINSEIDVRIGDKLIGQIDHVGGLLWDHDGEKDIELAIVEDGKLRNTVKFKAESNQFYQLGYLYSSGVLVMKGDGDSVINVSSSHSGAKIYRGYDKDNLQDTGFYTPHTFQRMSSALRWVPEYYQVKLGDEESEIIYKDNTFGDREVSFDFNTDLESKVQKHTKSSSTPVKPDIDPEVAFEECRDSAMSGNVNAQYKLGVMYEEGTGGAVSIKRAIKWYEEAISNGSQAAKNRLEKINQGTEESKIAFNIIATPSDATIRILNIEPKYIDGIQLPKGKYNIEISKIGYLTLKLWVTLVSDDPFIFTLKKGEPIKKSKKSPEDEAERKLTRLKKMFDKGLITKDEYKSERAEVLEKF